MEEKRNSAITEIENIMFQIYDSMYGSFNHINQVMSSNASLVPFFVHLCDYCIPVSLSQWIHPQMYPTTRDGLSQN